MATTGQQRKRQPPASKSLGEMGLDAVWFVLHSLAAVLFFAMVWCAITLTRPDPDSTSPKILATALAIVVPMVGACLAVRSRQLAQGAHAARFVWISGLLLFAAVSIWVLDLPTGPGLCEACGAMEKLWRTFFDINHGSGLMDGDGLLVGVWVPLAMIGYAMGAAFCVDE